MYKSVLGKINKLLKKELFSFSGIQPYGNELQAFNKTVNLKSASTVFDENIISMKTIYTTVRCHNNVGSYTTATSDGLTISEVPPSSDNAVITILPISKTEYGTSDYHQRDPTKIRMKWSGFTDRFDIMSFVVSIDKYLQLAWIHNKCKCDSKSVTGGDIPIKICRRNQETIGIKLANKNESIGSP
jgi:hypothetical protein